MIQQVKFLVDMPDTSSADKLIRTLNGKEIIDNYISYCSYAGKESEIYDQVVLLVDAEDSLTSVETVIRFKKILKKLKVPFDFVQIVDPEYQED